MGTLIALVAVAGGVLLWRSVRGRTVWPVRGSGEPEPVQIVPEPIEVQPPPGKEIVQPLPIVAAQFQVGDRAMMVVPGGDFPVTIVRLQTALDGSVTAYLVRIDSGEFAGMVGSAYPDQLRALTQFDTLPVIEEPVQIAPEPVPAPAPQPAPVPTPQPLPVVDVPVQIEPRPQPVPAPTPVPQPAPIQQPVVPVIEEPVQIVPEPIEVQPPPGKEIVQPIPEPEPLPVVEVPEEGGLFEISPKEIERLKKIRDEEFADFLLGEQN